MLWYNLKSKLVGWQAAGLISREQISEILQHEENSGSSRAQVSFIVLAAALIGGGIISLVAANWQSIPDAVKLIGNYGLLLAFACGVYLAFASGKKLILEGFLVGFAILVLASIGLNAQIFHLSGKFYFTGLFWSMLVMAPISYCQLQVAPQAVIGTFVLSLFAFLTDSPLISAYFEHSPAALGFAMPLLLAEFTLLARALLGDAPFTTALRQWVVYAGLLALAVAEFPLASHRHTDLLRAEPDFTPYFAGWILFCATAILIGKESTYRKFQKYLLWTALALFALCMHLPLFTGLPHVFRAAGTVLTCFALSFFMASKREWKGFNLLLGVVVFRFFWLYIEAIGGLARTGLGFIVSGFLLLLGVLAWRKMMPHFRAWIEERLA